MEYQGPKYMILTQTLLSDPVKHQQYIANLASINSRSSLIVKVNAWLWIQTGIYDNISRRFTYI